MSNNKPDDKKIVDSDFPADFIQDAVMSAVAEKKDFSEAEQGLSSSEPVQESVKDEPEVINENVLCEFDVTVPVADALPASAYALYTLRDHGAEVHNKLQHYPMVDQTGKRYTRWEYGYKYGIISAQKNFVHRGTLNHPNAQWRQVVEHESMRLGIGRPQTVVTGRGSTLTGEGAMFAVQAALGLGTLVQVPCWHSGLWITFRTPQDSALLALERRIQEERIQLGRDTNGVIYSNTMVYIVKHVFDFVLDHIYSVTMVDYSPEKLARLLRVTDLQTIVHALACSIYPNGYEHAQPCILTPDKCQNVAKDKIMLTKMFWTDRSRLTNAQVKHMANRVASYTEEQIVKYQEEGKIGNGRTVSRDGVDFVMHVPTIHQYVEAGVVWVEEIIALVNKTLSGEIGLKDRNDYINQQSRLVTLRQYGHWIRRIAIPAQEIVVDDREHIDKMLNILSSNDELVTLITGQIGEYIEESTISIIAIPSFKCPSCQKPMTSKEKRHPNLIPIDSVAVFFTLLDHRLLRAKTN